MQFDTSEYLEYLNNQIFGSNILYLEQTESTNDEMWDKIKEQNHLLIISDIQKKGRGRRENSWYSVKTKSLTFSIGLLVNQKNENLMALRASLATCEAINKTSNINAKIKWPNDIVINKKKIAGILIETKFKNSKIIYNIGIGINVNLDYGELDKNLENKMSSMFIESGEIQNREYLLSELVKSLNSIMKKDNQFVINQWMKSCSHINAEIFFHSESNKINGTFVGINLNGMAIIKSKNRLNYYSSGIVEL